MTDLERKAVQRVFELLEIAQGDLRDAKEILRQALAQPEQEPMQFKCTVVDDANPEGVPLSQWGRQPEQEPVAWMCEGDEWGVWNPVVFLGNDLSTHKNCSGYRNWQPLYTSPPKREWIGLTDDEINDWFFQRLKQVGAGWRLDDVIKAVEAKLKEKNT